MAELPKSIRRRASVLIPVHNAGKNLRATLLSVLRQSFAEIEILILDDASSDDAVQSNEDLLIDERVEVARNAERCGPAPTWNALLSAATGDFVKLLPQDDIMHPRQLERELDVLIARGQAVAAVSRYRLMTKSGQVVGPRLGPPSRHTAIDLAAFATASIRTGGNPIGPPGALLARRTLAQRAPYRATAGYAIDFQHAIELITGGPFFSTGEALHAFRIHNAAWSAAVRSEQLRDLRGVQAELLRRAQKGSTGPSLSLGARTRLRTAGRHLVYSIIG